MENRGRKRAELDDQLPEDKRPCSTSGFRPGSSRLSVQTQMASMNSTLESPDCEMETSPSASVSGRSECEAEKDSAYASCDSDGLEHEQAQRSFSNYYPWRSSGGHGRFRRILSSLTNEAEPCSQLAALTELCDFLSFCTEESLSCLSSDALAPVLVKLTKHEGSPDIMLLSVRAITYLCEVLPRSTAYLVRHGAVPALCARLMAIEYLDVAEQCLQALEKISRDHPLVCLKDGAIMAVLNYIDFFSTSIQRVAVSTVENICKKLPSDCSSHYMESVPILCNLLQYEDQKLIESVAISLIRIAERASHSSEMLDELSKHGVIHQTAHLIAMNARTTLSQPIYSGLIGLLARLASGSVVAARTLFEINISNTMKNILSYGPSHGRAYPLIADGNSNQVHEALKLLNYLLPPWVREDQDNLLVSDLEKILLDQPELLRQFGMDILPDLIQVVNSGANLYVCYGCLSVISKLFYFSRSDMLLDFLKTINMSSFLAGLFARKDHHVLISALRIVEILLQRLPDIFLNSFVKEGVIYAIDTLLEPEKCSESISLASSTSSFQLSSGSNKKSTTTDVYRCVCYAFDDCKSPVSSDMGTCKLEKDSVQTFARQIKATYFGTELHNTGIGLTEVLQKLGSLSELLTDKLNMSMNNDMCAQYEEILNCIVHKMMTELNGSEPMSTFEFIDSGIVKSLVTYLSNGEYLKEKGNDCGVFSYSHVIEKRFEMFAKFFFSSTGEPIMGMPLAMLIRKLQSALSSLEHFPVILSHVSKSRNSYTTIPHGLCTMQPCIKVRFVRELGERELCDYSADVLTFEPFSSLEAIEQFLWPKVCTNKSEWLMKSADQSIDQPKHQPIPHALGTRSSHDKDPNFVETNNMSSGFMEMQVEDNGSVSHSATEGVVEQNQAIRGETSASLDRTHPGPTKHDVIFFAEVKNGIMTRDSANGWEYSGSYGNGDAFPRLIFYLEGRQMDRELTLYQAILKQQMRAEHEMLVGPKFWNRVYKVTYKKASESKHNNLQECYHGSQISSASNKCGTFWKSVLVMGLPYDLNKSNPVYDILFLLKKLEVLNRYVFRLTSHARISAFTEGKIENLDDLKVESPAIPQTEFVSSKLTEKLEQQMRDPLAVSIGGMPPWSNQLMASCPFLFGFEIRSKYFRLAVFDSPQIQPHTWSQSANNNSNSPTDRRLYTGGLPRKKFQVFRSHILDSAMQMMELHAHDKSILEVEYNEEVGTGLGPTMEFFTLVSHEFQKVGLGMWREDQFSLTSGNSVQAEGSKLVASPFGLFPRPWSAAISNSNGIKLSEVTKKFVLLGQIMAKALQDGRVLDLPFSKAFYKLILGQELNLYDIQPFDPDLGRALLEFQALVDRKKYWDSVSQEGATYKSESRFHSTRIEDLCLDFTLPGYPEYILASGHDHKMVNMSNLEEYVMLIVDATVNSGISKQMEAFKSGFNQVFPIRSLQIFTEEELERLLCGEQNYWALNELLDHIKFDHGYTASSRPVINFLEIIQEFEHDYRRAFLQFVTGAPQLPPGGLAALNPKLTIVCKYCGEWVDGDLPSVMTCANYLKLPPYSSKKRMRERLLYAITEGQGSFHLS